MKKAALLLVLAAVLLLGCAVGQAHEYPELTSPLQQDPLSVDEYEDEDEEDYEEDYGDDYGEDYDWDAYDPSSEEDNGTAYMEGAVYDDVGNMVYAGATPIPLDPIDMPTPTPRPALSFTYGPVEISQLRLKFEAPAGWQVNASASDTVVISDPTAYDGVNATMTISITPVANSYRLNDVKATVREKLREIGQYNYTEWSTTSLSPRTLLKKDGYYANYRGVYYDGTVVRGRVMVALLDDHRIITVHMATPGWYNDSYMKVVAHFRDTAKLQ